MKNTLLMVVAIGLAIMAGSLYIKSCGYEAERANLILARDSALIKSGEAERTLEAAGEEWRTRFGIAQGRLETSDGLKEILESENKELRSQLDTRIIVHDTVEVQADATTDSTLHFSSPDADTVFAFDATVNTVQETLLLDWSLNLALQVSVAEAEDGRPDVFIRAPGLDNVAITIARYDYKPRSTSFWSRLGVGPMGTASTSGSNGNLGVIGCYESWCGFYGLLGEGEIGVAYVWRPFK